MRVLCDECKEEDHSPKVLAFRENIGLPPQQPLYRAVGCKACRHTGYYGRRAVFEMMPLNEEIRQMILQAGSSGQIREVARRYGLRSLSEDGWRLVGEGVTTVDEVLRVTKDERLNGSITVNGC